MMEYEREMIRQRIQSGVTRAIEQGKWVGRPPYGFSTNDDGYLQIEPENYLAMQSAIEYAKNNPDESVNGIARAHDVPQSTLDRALKNEEKAALYLEGDANDERVTDAIEEF
jgi:DNA invertase Pin-like site-specific DNA recombinase